MGHRKWSFGSAPAAEVSLKELEREHGELYDEWRASERRVMETLDENNRLDRELDEARQAQDNLIFQRNDFRHWHMNEQKKVADLTAELDEARKRIAELGSPSRVPFSDAQIERMAKAAHKEFRNHNWNLFPFKNDWCAGIRAALSAGGLEPCAVPEYAPDDVALMPSDDEVDALARVLHNSQDAFYCRYGDHATKFDDHTPLWRTMAHAAIVHLRPTQGHVLRDRLVESEAKIERQRVALKRLNALVADLRAEVDEDNANAASVNDLLVQVQNLTAERDAQEIELADLRFYQREFAAVSADRDELKAENLRLAGLYGLEYAKTVTVERDALKTQLQRATDHNRTITEGYKAEIAALRERASVPVKVRWNVTPEEFAQWHLEEFGNGNSHVNAKLKMDYLAAHAVIDPVGCELDVHPDQLELYKWVTEPDGGYEYAAQQAIDLCRSRIRPVFECKECDQWRKDWDTQAKAYEMLSKAYNAASKQLNAARAALEGE